MKVGIIGAGIVGSATGKVFEKAHTVYYYDKFKQEFSNPKNLEQIAKEAEFVTISVPTPMKSSGEMDYSAIYSSLDQLLEATHRVNREPEKIIAIIRSTAVSGTTERVAEKFPFQFVFNPEFLREKYAVEDMQNTKRVVLGANSKETMNEVLSLYKAVFPDAIYTLVNIRTAEMIKYAANVMLAAQIGIANELYRICRSVKVDYSIVKAAILQDDRIGKNIDVPGHDGDFGFGGKCFPKDLRALIYLAREHNIDPNLLQEVWRSNLEVRKDKDWLNIKGATTQNNFN
ncbi:UDP-glucose/GDP-mannose dehydrogenase family protein [Candidatus Pacearchaeota archaeon]|nr:UDP-glucose/GDP-mannose dehydrogenase family protein [Candidatus Pacearchaeota archaeon]